MKYVDYREKLGLGFDDQGKAVMLLNKITEFLKLFFLDSNGMKATFGERASRIVYFYCQRVGERIYNNNCYDILSSMTKEHCAEGYISKFIVLVNLATERGRHILLNTIKDFLDSLNIPYEIFEDEDGYFIFPKGAVELDDALVSAPLEWLNKYPQTRTEFAQALKDYSELPAEKASDVADKFRKALERFFQEFFGKNCTLENVKSDYGNFMKNKGVPTELSNNLETLLQAYTNFMNGYAKHHNKTSKNLLEYIMYQTGNVIRLIITLKSEEATDNGD